MHDHTSLLFPWLAMVGAMLAMDHLARIHIAEDLARAGALRAARTVAAGLDAEGRVKSGVMERSRAQAALALLPLVPDDGPRTGIDPALRRAASRLAADSGIRLGGDLSQAVARVAVRVQLDGRLVRDGTRIAPGSRLDVTVGYLHDLRPDPVAWVFADALSASPERVIAGKTAMLVGGT